MAQSIHRRDYRAPTHLIDTVKLEFDLDPESTAVINTMAVRPNPESAVADGILTLQGEDLTLVSVSVNGRALSESEYDLTKTQLRIPGITSASEVTIVNRFNPTANTALSGIYASGANLMSQCESQGFRRITYYLDRPDVLARFTVVIRAPKALYPVLLSNGNRKEERDLDDGRHMVVWEDPFPKPSYLFALVAGRLACRRETMRVSDGRSVTLEVWVEPQDLEKTAHTMESLKKAIRWDESRWGLPLDLDDFKIVATNDFNFGAMENKGLNIFNARYALANPAVATDDDYFNIESVVGHEYFHNWTGNRVTLRDWFQLTLKEGLTVFRDQEFSADMLGEASARAVQRIKDVIRLRSAQFPEDAGPMAHPIRPESYVEINNFYTTTVYEKGAEVIRMLQTLLGRETFRKGFDDYIRTNDGKAVTCEAFLEAMERASGRSLEQFRLWYAQAGTPRVTVRSRWDEATHTFALEVTQTTPPTPGQAAKRPFLIPFPVALLDADGNELPVRLLGEDATPAPGTRMFELTEASSTFVFTGLAACPVPSLNRGFAAPVIVEANESLETLAFLASKDRDPFNRWDAMQRLMGEVIRRQIHARLLKSSEDVDRILIDAVGAMLDDETLSPAFKALALELPSEKILGEREPLIDPQAVHYAREYVRAAIGKRWITKFLETVDANRTPGAYSPDPESAGRRALKNLALGYAHASGNPRATIALRDQFNTADNLTDKLAALQHMVNSQSPAKQDMAVEALREWYAEPLLINKWLTIQATASLFPGEEPVLERVRELMQTNFFSIKNPNNVYALLLAFFTQNAAEFHAVDGSGYRFWSEIVLELNRINPHVAARVARALENWRRYTPALSRQMYDALQFVYSRKDELSPNVLEVIEKTLGNPI